MPLYPVSPAKEKDLENRMARLGIRESDLEERFIRSSGAGGQNVNKVATCVYLSHRVSGIEVKCQSARTQGMNRYLARRLLCEKTEGLIEGKRSAEEQRREKIRRQKRKRSKRAKDKMLQEKRHRGGIKKLRKISSHEM